MNQALTSLKKNIQILGVAAASSVLLSLGASQAWAGQATVVTTGDSSASGAVNFDANAGSGAGVSVQTLSTAGASVTVTIAPNVVATVSSPATAVNNGTISQAQSDSGLGSGGAVVTLEAPIVAAIVAVANTNTGAAAVSGAGLQGSTSPSAAIATLATSPAVANVTVVTPSGVSVTIGAVLNNLSAALVGRNAVVLPTAINDASIAILTALRADPGNAELGTAGRAVAAILGAARGTAN